MAAAPATALVDARARPLRLGGGGAVLLVAVSLLGSVDVDDTLVHTRHRPPAGRLARDARAVAASAVVVAAVTAVRGTMLGAGSGAGDRAVGVAATGHAPRVGG